MNNAVLRLLFFPFAIALTLFGLLLMLAPERQPRKRKRKLFGGKTTMKFSEIDKNSRFRIIIGVVLLIVSGGYFFKAFNQIHWVTEYSLNVTVSHFEGIDFSWFFIGAIWFSIGLTTLIYSSIRTNVTQLTLDNYVQKEKS